MNPEESKEEKKQLLVHFLFITDCFKKSTFPKKKKMDTFYEELENLRDLFCLRRE
jgi:hypothetical protein